MGHPRLDSRSARASSRLDGPGDIRGYDADARTGKLVWTFHVAPRTSEFGYETWLNNSADINGLAGTWSWLTADEESGYLHPVRSAFKRLFRRQPFGQQPVRQRGVVEKCPRFIQLKYHNHGAGCSHLNTADDYLGKEILDWVSEGFAGTRKGTVSQ